MRLAKEGFPGCYRESEGLFLQVFIRVVEGISCGIGFRD